MAVFTLPVIIVLSTAEYNYVYTCHIPSTCATDPLLFLPPCYLLYISNEGMVEEEGVWSEEEWSIAFFILRSRVNWYTCIILHSVRMCITDK